MSRAEAATTNGERKFVDLAQCNTVELSPLIYNVQSRQPRERVWRRPRAKAVNSIVFWYEESRVGRCVAAGVK